MFLAIPKIPEFVRHQVGSPTNVTSLYFTSQSHDTTLFRGSGKIDELRSRDGGHVVETLPQRAARTSPHSTTGGTV